MPSRTPEGAVAVRGRVIVTGGTAVLEREAVAAVTETEASA
jgi:hypothetical protein